MERGDVARLLNVAEADVAAFKLTDDGLFVDLVDAGRRVVTDGGVFACDDHPSGRQLRRWAGAVVDPASGAPQATEVEAESDAPALEVVPDGGVEQVLAWVGGDPLRVQQALETEQARSKPRATLIAQLEKLESL